MNFTKCHSLLSLWRKRYKSYSFFVSLLLITSITTKSVNADTSWHSALKNEEHQQLILVVTDDWQADKGFLYTFNRSIISQDKNETKKFKWIRSTPSRIRTAVTIGKKGLAWGIGLHPKQNGTYKVEGDGKAPAGIFSLGGAFGYLNSLTTGLNYQAMSNNDFCIDVNGSPYYNQLVNRLVVGKNAVRGSTEAMRRDIHYKGDQRYKKGIFLQHNKQNIDAAGSCIFMHIWKNENTPTAGCTAMSEKNMDDILAWLDTDKKPLYVALPKVQYLALKLKWYLPDL